MPAPVCACVCVCVGVCFVLAMAGLAQQQQQRRVALWLLLAFITLFSLHLSTDSVAQTRSLPVLPLARSLTQKANKQKQKQHLLTPALAASPNTLSVPLSFSLFLSVTCCAPLLLFLLRLQILCSFCCQCCQINFRASYKDWRTKSKQTCKG